MGVTNSELVIKINATAKGFQAELSKIEARTKALEESLEKIAKISGVAFSALTASIGLAVNEFAKFEDSFTNVIGLLDKSSFGIGKFDEGVDELRKGVLDLGIESGKSFEDLSKGLQGLLAAGVPVEKSLKNLSIAVDFADVAATDTATAVKGLTTVMNAYGIGVEYAQEVADKLFETQKFGKLSAEDLAETFGRVGVNAASLGINLDELLAAVAAISASGKPVKQAYSGIDEILQGLAQPSQQATLEAQRLGVEFNTTALKAKGLQGFLKSLTEAEGFNQKSLSLLFGSVNAQATAFALTGAQAGNFKRALEQLTNTQKSAADFQEQLKIKNATVQQNLEKLAQSFKSLAIVIGEQFGPVILIAAKVLGAIASTVVAFNPTLLKVIAGVTALITGIAGLVTFLAAGALAFLKVQAIMETLLVAFPAISAAFVTFGEISAAALAGATAGFSLLVAGVINAGVQFSKLFSMYKEWKVLNEESKGETGLSADVKAIVELQKHIEEEKRQIEDLQKIQSEAGANSNSLYQQQIALQKEQLRVKLDADQKELASELAKRKASQNTNSGSGPATSPEVDKTKILIANLEERLNYQVLYNGKMTTASNLFTQEQIKNAALVANTIKGIVNQSHAKLLQDQLDFIDKKAKLEAEADEAFNKAKQARQLQAYAEFLENERRFGKADATLRKLQHSDAVKGFAQGTGELRSLMGSRNKTLFEIGKAAAIADVTIKTAQSAMNIFEGFSEIPYVGYALGIAGAAAAIAYGAEQISDISSTSFSGAEGGVVPTVPGNARIDGTPMNLDPGEVIIPKKLAPTFADFVKNNGKTSSPNGSSGDIYNFNVGTLFAEDKVSIAKIYKKFQEYVRFNNVKALGAAY